MLDLIGLAVAGGGETLRSASASQGGDQSVGHFGELGRGGNGGQKAFTPEGGRTAARASAKEGEHLRVYQERCGQAGWSPPSRGNHSQRVE